jgi:glycosyltransferase involved in cell wall biosynthesis
MNTHRPYRIGIDARFYRKETGGIGRYTRELLHQMFELDHVNEYVVFLTPADMAEWDIDQPNVRPVVTPIPHYTVKEQTSFAQLLYKEKLDLVHFLNFNHPLVYRKPFVITLHDLTLFHFNRDTGLKKQVKEAGFKLAIKHAVRASKRVIAISEFGANDAEKTLKVSHAKMDVVYEGGPERVQLLPGAKDAVRKYTGAADPYFLFVSQWRPHKGIVTLLDAFTSFKKKTGLPHKLILAGRQVVVDEEIRSRLVGSPYAADIIAPGFVPDELLPALYAYSTALVMPSEYEGFGLPVLEAFTHGTAVICSDATSLPEVGGEGAAYFPVRDAEALAGRMIEVATDQAYRADLIEKGTKQLRSLSWRKCAEGTLATYRAALAR